MNTNEFFLLTKIFEETHPLSLLRAHNNGTFLKMCICECMCASKNAYNMFMIYRCIRLLQQVTQCFLRESSPNALQYLLCTIDHLLS